MSDTCPDCGGDGTRFVSLCAKHQLEQFEKDKRRNGIPDIVVSINDPTLFTQLREQLPRSASGYLLVKVIP